MKSYCIIILIVIGVSGTFSCTSTSRVPTAQELACQKNCDVARKECLRTAHIYAGNRAAGCESTKAACYAKCRK